VGSVNRRRRKRRKFLATESVRKDAASIWCTVLRPLGYGGAAMQDEAVITINGVKLSDAESMTVRVAVDTLANVLAEGLEEKEAQELTALYMDSLARIQALLEIRETRRQ